MELRHFCMIIRTIKSTWHLGGNSSATKDYQNAKSTSKDSSTITWNLFHLRNSSSSPPNSRSPCLASGDNKAEEKKDGGRPPAKTKLLLLSHLVFSDNLSESHCGAWVWRIGIYRDPTKYMVGPFPGQMNLESPVRKCGRENHWILQLSELLNGETKILTKVIIKQKTLNWCCF